MPPSGYNGSRSVPQHTGGWGWRVIISLGPDWARAYFIKLKPTKPQTNKETSHSWGLNTMSPLWEAWWRLSAHRGGSFAHHGGGKSHALSDKVLPLLMHGRLSWKPSDTLKWTFSPLAYSKWEFLLCHLGWQSLGKQLPTWTGGSSGNCRRRPFF